MVNCYAHGNSCIAMSWVDLQIRNKEVGLGRPPYPPPPRFGKNSTFPRFSLRIASLLPNHIVLLEWR